MRLLAMATDWRYSTGAVGGSNSKERGMTLKVKMSLIEGSEKEVVGGTKEQEERPSLINVKR